MLFPEEPHHCKLVTDSWAETLMDAKPQLVTDTVGKFLWMPKTNRDTVINVVGNQTGIFPHWRVLGLHRPLLSMVREAKCQSFNGTRERGVV